MGAATPPGQPAPQPQNAWQQPAPPAPPGPAQPWAAPSGGAGSPPWPSVGGGGGQRRPRRGLLLGGTAAAIVVLYLVIAAVAQTFPFSKATPKPTTSPRVVVTTSPPVVPTSPGGCPDVSRGRADIPWGCDIPCGRADDSGGGRARARARREAAEGPAAHRHRGREHRVLHADGHPVDEPRPGAGARVHRTRPARGRHLRLSGRQHPRLQQGLGELQRLGEVRQVDFRRRARRRPVSSRPARSNGTTGTSPRARARCSSASPRARARACTSGRTRPRTRSSSCRRRRPGLGASFISGGGSMRHEPR